MAVEMEPKGCEGGRAVERVLRTEDCVTIRATGAACSRGSSADASAKCPYTCTAQPKKLFSLWTGRSSEIQTLERGKKSGVLKGVRS